MQFLLFCSNSSVAAVIAYPYSSNIAFGALSFIQVSRLSIYVCYSSGENDSNADFALNMNGKGVVRRATVARARDPTRDEGGSLVL